MTTIRRQLRQSLLVTIAVIVLLMTIAFFLVEIISFRQLVTESAVPKAELIALHLRRPLAQGDSWTAQEILATLATDPSIEGAYLFNQQAQPFAYYQQIQNNSANGVEKLHLPYSEPAEILPILALNSKQTIFSWNHLAVFIPIVHNSTTIGTVYVASTLTPFYLRLLWWLLAAAAATTFTIFTGLAIARKLQKRITKPISDLAAMMTIVSNEGDLTQRAPVEGRGEIATLAHGFNSMLEAIQARDDELLTINFDLEAKIAERTEELNSSLQEKELLLKEIHHRVKNNLQIVSSLLSLQMKKIQDPGANSALQTSLSRIRSISIIHEKLHQRDRQSTSSDLGVYLRDLAEEIFRLYSVTPERIRLQHDLHVVPIDFDRLINLSLIFNELFTNTVKHAFSATETGVVTVRLRQHKDKVILTIQDNGRGLPDNFLLEATPTVGLQLTHNLVRQAEGQFTLLRNQPGTEAIVSFPLIA